MAMCSTEDNQVESNDLQEVKCTPLHPCKGLIAYNQHFNLFSYVWPLSSHLLL
jgi:hypothetical protein